METNNVINTLVHQFFSIVEVSVELPLLDNKVYQ